MGRVVAVMTKLFHLGDILSITTRVLLSPRGMDGVRDIMSFMMHDEFVGDLALVMLQKPCADALIEQHPHLGAVQLDHPLTPEEATDFLTERVREFGEMLPCRTVKVRAMTGE